MTEEQNKYITYAVWLQTRKHMIPDIDFLMSAAEVGITSDNWKVMNEFLKELEESNPESKR